MHPSRVYARIRSVHRRALTLRFAVHYYNRWWRAKGLYKTKKIFHLTYVKLVDMMGL